MTPRFDPSNAQGAGGRASSLGAGPAPMRQPRSVTPPTDGDRDTAQFREVRRVALVPVEVLATLRVMRRGGGDPTWRDGAGGGFYKAWRTPAGPATVWFHERRDPDRAETRRRIGVDTNPDAASGGGAGSLAPSVVDVLAWGPGAGWVIDRADVILGNTDAPESFVPRHERVVAAQRAHPGWRVPRTGLVLEALVPSIIEQRVIGADAFAAYRRLVRAHGAPAPGPGAARGLWVAPDASGWARIPSWEWLRAGVDPGRAATAVRSARVAGRLEQGADLGLDTAHARLRSVPGVGVWTAAEVAHVALGDADAVSFGDYHVAKNIGWALTGVEVDDAGLAELLAADAPHRYRVQRLLELSGARRPRHGPRLSLPTHLPR